MIALLSIQQATLITPRQCIEGGSVLIDADRIIAVNEPPPSRGQTLDATGLALAPGFIDLQINGAFGFDFTAEPKTIWEAAARITAHGVTSFLPTIITSPLDTVAAAQDVLRVGPPPNFHGATPLGLHLEGPFLNPIKRGAHNPIHLRQPDLNAVAEWSRDSGVRLVTLAPELGPVIDLIHCLREQGVIVSAGHSMATFEEAVRGFDSGITYATHLFNAMPALEHRAPGLVAAALADPRTTVGLIPDGIHLHPAIVKLIWQCKGAELISVVTDAIAALGMPPGKYSVGELTATVDGPSARLDDGTLAGSILSLDQAIRNLIAFTGCSLGEAISTVTTTPARLLGLADRGQIAPGFIADLVLLTSDLKVAKTIVRGKVVFES